MKQSKYERVEVHLCRAVYGVPRSVLVLFELLCTLDMLSNQVFVRYCTPSEINIRRDAKNVLRTEIENVANKGVEREVMWVVHVVREISSASVSH